MRLERRGPDREGRVLPRKFRRAATRRLSAAAHGHVDRLNPLPRRSRLADGAAPASASRGTCVRGTSENGRGRRRRKRAAKNCADLSWTPSFLKTRREPSRPRRLRIAMTRVDNRRKRACLRTAYRRRLIERCLSCRRKCLNFFCQCRAERRVGLTCCRRTSRRHRARFTRCLAVRDRSFVERADAVAAGRRRARAPLVGRDMKTRTHLAAMARAVERRIAGAPCRFAPQSSS